MLTHLLVFLIVGSLLYIWERNASEPVDLDRPVELKFPSSYKITGWLAVLVCIFVVHDLSQDLVSLLVLSSVWLMCFLSIVYVSTYKVFFDKEKLACRSLFSHFELRKSEILSVSISDLQRCYCVVSKKGRVRIYFHMKGSAQVIDEIWSLNKVKEG